MTDAELLDRAPARAVDHETDDETDAVILLQPRFRWRWVQKLFAPTPQQRFVRIHLDALGSWVWRRLDGHSPLRSLLSDLAQAFPDEPDATRRLLLFVRQLAGNGLITIRAE